MPKKMLLGYFHEHEVTQVLRLLLESCLESSLGRLTESCMAPVIMAGFADSQCGFFGVPLEKEILFFCCRHCKYHVWFFFNWNIQYDKTHGWTAFTWKLVLHVSIYTCLFFWTMTRTHCDAHSLPFWWLHIHLPQIQIACLFFLMKIPWGWLTAARLFS